MPLIGLRANRSEKDLHRRSTLDPGGFFKRGEKALSANASAEFLTPDRATASHNGETPNPTEVGRASWSADTQQPPPSPPIQEHTPNTRRFSIMRFRHASDSQLSAKAKERAAGSVPPVPAIPAAPAIITTAPTSDNLQLQQPLKKKGRLQQFTRRRLSFDPDSAERPHLRKSMDKKISSDHKRGTFGYLRGSYPVAEDPGRLSTTQLPGALPESGHEAQSTLSLPVPRMSDSSRSDGSSGDHVTFANAPKPQISSNTNGRFRFPRRNKQRASLFPLPMKISPPEFPDTAPATPRASTSAVSTGSPNHSPGEYSPPLTAVYRSNHHADQENGTTPPLPSPSHVALAAASMNFTAPGTALLRNDSTKSVRSSRSSPNAGHPLRLGRRGRSSTMGSLGGRSDDAPPPTPPFASSGRNSTSTTGRSSLSNLFSLGNRFRQNSEPHSPRHGSPAYGFSGTPRMSSHNNSLNISREALVIPKREEGEAPGRYLERLEEVMDRSIIAGVMSKTNDPFSLAVLRSYMRKFAFFGDPIDMAIRKLLMEVELPKETQQIDRVLQGFADRYHECNPGIYINPDKAYFISFSIVILHTDFFNKNNKRKMQRQDYIKNSSCEGVSGDVLGCIYDNIVYTPFIHFEDDIDIKGIASRRGKKTTVFKAPINMNDPARKATREPIDPYTLIFEGKLDVLRPTIKDVMNLDDPYTYLGTAPSLDTRTLYNSFSKYGVIQIVSSRSRPEAFMSAATQENPEETQVGIVEMPVTKVGILWRKDTKRKAARSPWQEWGAILTRSGLSFFKNHGWAKNLMYQHEQHQRHGFTGPVVFKPPLQEFKADHVIPTDGAVALVDTTYKKHKHAFVVFSKGGAEETFLADTETDLNDWLGKLNYSAAFETLGVRPRGLVGGLYEGQRNRGIRRLESSHSTKSITTTTGDVTIQSGKIDNQFAQQMITARRELMQLRISEAEEKLSIAIKQLDAQLRDARHLQILAPIQPKTRELVIHAAGRLSAKLKWVRIEIWRMKCHRDILAMELEEEKNVANEKQARIDRIAGASAPQQQAQSAKGSKISGLARLNSRASTMIGGQKVPHSPSASVRPATKSSRETEFAEDIFKTPPETSRQSSPSHPPGQWELPPLSFSSVSSNHRASLVSASAQSPSLIPREHRPSVSTNGDKPGSEISDTASHYTTPPPVEDVEPRQSEVQSAGPSNLDGVRPDTASESEPDRTHAPLTGSPESRSKVRRSLHRTLRDSHGGPGHRRSGKGKDSSSTVISDDTPESEGLSRAKGSFTVHGKKASVITFGSEWQKMPAEERLKVRKQAQEVVQEVAVGEEEKENSADEQAASIASESTATARSLRVTQIDEDTTPRPSTNEKRGQRQVSSQTIVPQVSRPTANGHSFDIEGKDDDDQAISVRDESSFKHSISDEEDSGPEHVGLHGPKTQAVEA